MKKEDSSLIMDFGRNSVQHTQELDQSFGEYRFSENSTLEDKPFIQKSAR